LVLFEQRKCNAALEDEVKFSEVLTTLNDSLISNENATIKLRSKVADELFTTLHVLVEEDVLEII